MTAGVAIAAQLYDGQTARRHDVTVVPEADGLRILHDDGAEEQVAADVIRQGQHLGGALSLQRTDRAGWRLLIADPGSQPWLKRYERADDLIAWARRKGWGKVIGGSLAAVLALVVIGYNSIDIGVRLLPESLTRQMGLQIADQMAGGDFCASPTAEAALNDLARRMFPSGLGLAQPLAVKVANDPTENAFATPGGIVVLFGGLIEKAQSGDEVAAVIAHEFGHVEHRHPERMLVRAFGVGLFLSGAGGDVGAMADAMMTLSASRDYERQADATAFAALDRLDISPAGFAAFFERMAAKAKTEADKGERSALEDAASRLGSYFSTHPEMTARARAARAQMRSGASYRPAFTPAQWQAIRTMCEGDAA